MHGGRARLGFRGDSHSARETRSSQHQAQRFCMDCAQRCGLLGQQLCQLR